MPAYTVECQELLAAKSLRGFVTLKGYGNPKKVLADTWVFMNSSISEGLPLAIGEAGLTGAPIVCTDVGATFQVLTDPDDPKKRYGTVIAPNDPRALARGQIALLAVMDQWEVYGEDDVSPGPTPDKFTPGDVARITQRMYDRTPQRRHLGSQLRRIVQSSFSGDRYLREHEQMLWIGKYKSEILRKKMAADNQQTVIEMLDDVDTQEYRPEFLRRVSGFSAFSSAPGSEINLPHSRDQSRPSSSIAGDEGEFRRPRFEYAKSAPINSDRWRSVTSKDLEKGQMEQVAMSDHSDYEDEDDEKKELVDE